MCNNKIEYYRNLFNLKSQQGVYVDKGSLWKMEKDGILVLVDEDQYLEAIHSSEMFEKVN